MKKTSFYLSLIAVLAAVTLSFGAFTITRLLMQTRWDKVPVARTFVLGVLQYFGVDASKCDGPITWDQLDERPSGWPNDEYWFDHINAYTLRLLKKYMRENNLAIVPKDYRMKTTITWEELIEILEFTKTENSSLS